MSDEAATVAKKVCPGCGREAPKWSQGQPGYWVCGRCERADNLQATASEKTPAERNAENVDDNAASHKTWTLAQAKASTPPPAEEAP